MVMMMHRQCLINKIISSQFHFEVENEQENNGDSFVYPKVESMKEIGEYFDEMDRELQGKLQQEMKEDAEN